MTKLQELEFLIGSLANNHARQFPEFAEMAEGFRETAGKARAILGTWERESDAARTDPDRSPEGRRKRLQELAEQARAATAT